MSQVPGRQRHPSGPHGTASGSKVGTTSGGAFPAPAGLRPGTADTCPICRQAIRWHLTENLHRIAVNPDPHPDGTVTVNTLPDGTIRARILPGHQLPAQGEAWVDHRRTCTDSPHRQRREAAAAPKCRACRLPMDAELARLERWLYHPSCDPAGVLPKREKRTA